MMDRIIKAKYFPEGEQCDNCRFYQNYECRRHAPIIIEDNIFNPRYPRIVFNHWCGDWELDIVKLKFAMKREKENRNENITTNA